MTPQTGIPTQSGRYVCWLPGVKVATVVRIFIPGHGWCNHLDEPVAGTVAGWIGPLPVFDPPAQDFDL